LRKKLERIITQKWISMYPEDRSVERVSQNSYPKLFPVVINNSGGKVSTATFIRRVNIPPDEYLNQSLGAKRAAGDTEWP